MIIAPRKTSVKGIELIKRFEGFSPRRYLCAGGYATIGFGHRLLDNENYSLITLNCAEEILLKDLARFELSVMKYITVELFDHQFDALVSFTFNLGPAALQRSTLRCKINSGNYSETHREFLKWIYAGGKRLNGLIKRRLAESELFAGNEYQISCN